jgi:hypothetical protein
MLSPHQVPAETVALPLAIGLLLVAATRATVIL